MPVAEIPVRDRAYEDALVLLGRVPLIDGHNDLPHVVRNDRTAKGDVRTYDLSVVHAETDTDIPRMRSGKLSGQFFAAYVPPGHPHPAVFALSQIVMMRNIAERYARDFRLALTPDDVETARSEGRIALFMGIENGSAVEDELDALDGYWHLGVRLMTLCHNRTHDWCDSATDAPRHDGLSSFGRDVVRRMNRLGMMVDLSHASPKAAHDALDVTEAPVVWSHSNALALCDHPRNMPEDLLERVVANDGVVMATFVPDFVSQPSRDWHRPAKDTFGKTPDGVDPARAEAELTFRFGPRPQATLAEFCDHVEYLEKRVGREHVGIGSDFAGGVYPKGLEDASTYPALVAELMRRGWSDDALTRLVGGNVLRVMERVASAAAEIKARSTGPRT